MSISKIELGAGVARRVLDVTQSEEVSGELTMPDYYPEIRRIVSVTASPLPDSAYISNEEIEVGGTVAFDVLYIGDDGTLASVPYVVDYSAGVPAGRDFKGGSKDIRQICNADSVVCRPLGPRTISLKAKLRIRVVADCREDCSVAVVRSDGRPASPEERRGLERLESSAATALCSPLFVTGNVSGEKEMTESARPIQCKGSVIIEKAECTDGAALVNGTFLVSCLVMYSDGTYGTVNHPIPFEERISADGPVAGCACAAQGRAASVSVVQESDNTLSVKGEYDIDVTCYLPVEGEVTEDAYSSDRAVQLERAEIDAVSHICLENGALTVSGEGRRRTVPGEGDRIICTGATASLERVDVKDSKAVFYGECVFKVYIASDGEVVTEEVTVPIKYEAAARESASQGDIVWNACIIPWGCECRSNENTLTCSCKLSVYAEAMKKTRISPIRSVTLGQMNGKDRNETTVQICYPEKGKRVWDIAKENGASLGECERCNRVSRHELSDGSPLILK
ncbi:MAG: DUF3794 domain-containing protein [Clostridia bacterium]|nr:DUF3794 domain-containing protein [Clostridia bacterium]